MPNADPDGLVGAAGRQRSDRMRPFVLMSQTMTAFHRVLCADLDPLVK